MEKSATGDSPACWVRLDCPGQADFQIYQSTMLLLPMVSPFDQINKRVLVKQSGWLKIIDVEGLQGGFCLEWEWFIQNFWKLPCQWRPCRGSRLTVNPELGENCYNCSAQKLQSSLPGRDRGRGQHHRAAGSGSISLLEPNLGYLLANMVNIQLVQV